MRAKFGSDPTAGSKILSFKFISTASTGVSMERTKMPNLRNGSKGGSEPGLT